MDENSHPQKETLERRLASLGFEPTPSDKAWTLRFTNSRGDGVGLPELRLRLTYWGYGSVVAIHSEPRDERFDFHSGNIVPPEKVLETVNAYLTTIQKGEKFTLREE